MQAAWYEKLGAANKVLVVGAIDKPVPKSNEVLVRIYTSGVNPSDVKMRAGSRGEIDFPRIIPHGDGAGVIEAVGEGVSQQRLGQRVWLHNARWQRAYGTAAEYVALPAELAATLPDNTDFYAGACLGVPAITAHHCVFGDGDVDKKTILVTGGAGSVGHYAIELAKWRGATVISTVSSAEKAEYAKAIGADYVLNYRTQDVAEVILDLTRGAGVDRIIDVDFGGNLTTSIKILKTYGCIATYASMGNMHPALPFYNLMFKGISIRTVFVYLLPLPIRQRAIADINNALIHNRLTNPIAAKYRLADIVAAHEFVEKGNKIGQVVLE